LIILYVAGMTEKHPPVMLTSAKHPHSMLDPVEALFHQHGLDINEHAELIRDIEALLYRPLTHAEKVAIIRRSDR
jgi:hypothetical protein